MVYQGGKKWASCLAIGQVLWGFMNASPLAVMPAAGFVPSRNGGQKESILWAENQQLNRLGEFRVYYQDSSQKFHQALQYGLQKSGLFEKIVQGLNNSGLVVRSDIPVVFQDCGEANAFYNPNPETRRIVLCYELITEITQDLQKLNNSSFEEALSGALYASIFVFYHELGHALIDVLSLPAVGKEEDAVDQFSAMILLNSEGQELAQKTIFSAAAWLGTSPKIPAWDEHAPNDVRFYYLVCLVYGSAPDNYSGLLKILPQERANRCPREYAKVSESWTKLLMPHFAEVNRPWQGQPYPRQNPPTPPAFNGNRRRIW